MRQGDEEGRVVNAETGALPGERICIAACPKLDQNRPGKSQRLASSMPLSHNLYSGF